MTRSRVEAAIWHGGVEHPDARGLMPLDEARARLAAVTVFERGEGRLMPGRGCVDDSDVLWAALLSLADAEEACAAAARLEWRHPPRGFDNIDLYERYGEGILPFIETRVRGDRLLNEPWCVVPCLMACDSDEAFELAMRVSRDTAGNRLDTVWLDRHPTRGTRLLGERIARSGDPRAWSLVVGLWVGRHHDAVTAAAGDVAALSWMRGGPWPSLAILALLDAFALRDAPTQLLLWPQPPGAGARAVHATRIVALRNDDDWGIAILRVEGERPGGVFPLRIAVYAFGSAIEAAARCARAGELPLGVGDLPASPREATLQLAEILRRDPAAVFGDVARVAPLVGIGPDFEVVSVEDLGGAEALGERPGSSVRFGRIAAALAR